MSRWCHAAACRAGLPAKPSEWSSSSSRHGAQHDSGAATQNLGTSAECWRDQRYSFACQSWQVVLILASIKCRSASAGTFSPSAKPVLLKQQPGAERDSCVPTWIPSSSAEPLRRADQQPRRPAAVRHEDCRTPQRLRSVTHTLSMVRGTGHS